MLKYLKVRNYLSICDELELNLEATQYGAKKGNFFNIGKTTLSKSKLIYGANASGKTTLIRALWVVWHTALVSAKWGELMSTSPFLLNENSSKEPSFFEVGFFVTDKEYIYNFSIYDGKIVTENLIEVRSESQLVLFARNNTGVYHIDTSFQSEADKGLEKLIDTASFLSVLNSWNGQLAGKPIGFFFGKINIVLSGSGEIGNDSTLDFLKSENNKNKELFIEFLRCADLHVDDIRVTSPSQPDDSLSIIKQNPSVHLQVKKTRVEIGHKKASGEMQYFDIQHESSGTKRLFSLLGFLVKTIRNEEILFVDEIETNLHPHILKSLLALIHADLGQKYQFIFTTHNTDILDLEIMKKEQILFLNRNEALSSGISSLAKYPSVRSENDIKKMYDQGVFGGIPTRYPQNFTSIIKKIINE